MTPSRIVILQVELEIDGIELADRGEQLIAGNACVMLGAEEIAFSIVKPELGVEHVAGDLEPLIALALDPGGDAARRSRLSIIGLDRRPAGPQALP